MSATVEEIQTKIDEIYNNVTEVNSQLHGALQGALDRLYDLSWLPDWAKQQARDKAQEAWREYQKIPPKLDPATKQVLMEISDYLGVRAIAPQYCAVDFSSAAAALGAGALGPRGDDWDSGNTQHYRNAVQSLPTKLQNLQDAVEDICTILSDLKDDYDSYFVGVLLAVISVALAVAGVVVAVISLVSALPTAGAGLALLIIGVVLAVASLLVAVLAFWVLPDMDASRATAAQRLADAAASVRNSPWPAKPALDSGDWR